MTSKKDVLDLASLDSVKASNTPYELELVHPVTREPLGMFIQILGAASDRNQEYLNEKFDEEARQAAEHSRRGTRAPIQSRQQTLDEGTRQLVALTVGFKNLRLDGQPLEFNIPNAIALYNRIPWIKAQVDNGVTALGNFIKS